MNSDRVNPYKVEGIEIPVKELVEKYEYYREPTIELLMKSNNVRQLSLEELKEKYIDEIGTFYIYQEEDGEIDGKLIIRKELCYLLREK